MGNTANGKRDWGQLLIIAGIVCMIAAGLWYGIQTHLESKAGKQAEELLEAVVQKREGQPKETPTEEVKHSAVRKENTAAQMVSEVYATVEIPSLHLQVPVLDAWSMENLSIAPCRYSGEIEQNNLVLLGHNYDGHFGALKNVQIGEHVYLENMDGQRFQYKIKEVFVIDPLERERVEESGYPLTIFTCTTGGQARLVINCTWDDT